MQDIKQIIQDSIEEVLAKLGVGDEDSKINLEHPVQENHGDYSCNIAMVMINKLDKEKLGVNSPRDLAAKIVEELNANEGLKKLVEKIEIAGPGFINFFLEKDYFVTQLEKVLKDQDTFGHGYDLKGKRIMVEYAHPNPFKAFHIGHLRNIVLGESLCRLLETQGAEVIRVNYQGDVGMHIAKCLWAFMKIDPKDYPETNDERVALIGKCYAEGATAFEDDEEIKKKIVAINKNIYSKDDEKINDLWELGKKWSIDKFHEIFDRLYTSFQYEYVESEVVDDCMKYIQEAKDKGILEDSKGAVVFNGEKHKLDTRVFLNSEGLPTYEGKELGLAYREFKDFGDIDLCIHNVAIEQISFFKVTFKVEELLDPELFKGKQYHNAYEFVGLKSGKMSSRKGQVVLGNDIINQTVDAIKEVVMEKGNADNTDEVSEKMGIGAIKFSFLKMSPFKYLAFDVKESINMTGDSGPYLQYTHARCFSVLEKAGESSDLLNLKDSVALETNEEEMKILKWLYRFPEVVALSAQEYSPNHICTYLNELAQRYNTFYNKHSVMNAETDDVKKFRVAITKATAQVIKNGLDLLGIKAPEKV